MRLRLILNKRKFKGNLSRDDDMKRVLLVILILAALAISGCTENQDKAEKSVEELHPAFEGALKTGLRNRLNGMLSLGKIRELGFSDFSVIR